MSLKDAFSRAFEIIETIEGHGGQAYIVGGSVRDYLSERPIGDIDIATSLLPEQVQQIFDKVIPIGIEHGTVMVRHRSESYEVTTFRKEEGYEDYRHPDHVRFVSKIEDDLARRDFTMNAMAMDRHGEVTDPYGGRDDLIAGKIRAVGDPRERFEEDPLRMLRAVRFASQLQFDIEANTFEAIQQKAHLLKHIAVERVAVETEKLYKGIGYKAGIRFMIETNLMKQLPVFRDYTAERLPVPEVRLHSWSEMLAFYLILDNGIELKDWVKQWKLSNAIKRESETLILCMRMYINQEVSPWLLYNLPDSFIAPFVRVMKALKYLDVPGVEDIQNRKRQLPVQDKNDITFQAQDLLRLYEGKERGPWIASTLRRIEQAVVEQRVPNDYEKIKEWVKWNPPANS
ncbi:CCA tRNA nucleotidyltransferase [Halobacillus fulvus]|nr:CCA tRNA nucleotidyltransferase [Halobacillus fulvus]